MIRSTAFALALAALASLSLFSPVESKALPAKREYDTHVYYVLELDSSQLPPGLSQHDVASVLGAEHVEQVGELKDHYLLRARNEHVFGDGAPLSKRSVDAGDAVLRRYRQLKRKHILNTPTDSILPPLGEGDRRYLRQRDVLHSISAQAIRSLERQQPRLRAKREMSLPPPNSRGRYRSLRSPASELAKRHPIVPVDTVDLRRQTAAVASNIVAAAQEFEIKDPLFPRQWHIVNGQMPDNSINVTGVWSQGYFGKGVNVAIVDDGLDMHSDDLKDNFHAEGSWDYNDNTALPEPRLSDDQHGTRCAGEIAAAKNDVCGVGVAYEAGIAGIRILSASISDADEASALNYGYQTNDIYSCSWGPPDDGRSMDAPGRLIKKAMWNGVTNGRNGKGSIFVFASGNGGGSDDQCNFDGYTNSILSVTVGAIDRKGLHPSYSEACSANMVVTYSSGSGDNIHTTDVGKNVCTDRHGGTSAAAPIAAGIFALVLEARPELTWRDVQHLCVETAVQVNPSDPDWQLTASGRYFNHKFGFGKLDAFAIVEAAKTWDLVKPQVWWNSNLTTASAKISDKGAVSTIEVTAEDLAGANFEALEHVTFNVHVEHDRRGEVEVEVISPRGMKSILARPRRFDDSQFGMPNWVFMSVKHWSEDPIGTWTITVRDRKVNDNNGRFNSWSMTLWGSAIDAELAVPYTLPSDPFDPESVAEDEEAAQEAEQEQEGEGESQELPTEDEAQEQEQDEEDWEEVGVPKPSQAPSDEHYDDALEHELSATKVYAKPTEHLPDDHASQPGETHPPSYNEEFDNEFEDGLHPTATAAVPIEDVAETPVASTGFEEGYIDEDDSTSASYLSSLTKLNGSTTWLFVAGGTIVVFVGAVSAFFYLRKSSLRRGRGSYDFAPQDDDDFEMDEGGLASAGKRRTRDLFNAFAIDDSDDEIDREQREHKERGQRYTDEGMKSFEDDEEEQGRSSAQREREAREHFSD